MPVSCTPPGGQYCGADRRRLPPREGMPRLPRRRPDLHGPHLRRGTDLRPRHLHRTRAAPATAAASAPAAARRSTAAPARPATRAAPTASACPRTARRPAATSRGGGGKYCGRIGDGCGRTIDCTCAAPLTCGGTGIAERVRRSELRADHVQPDGRRPVLRADRQRLRQGARLPGHLPGRRRPARRTTSARAAAAPPAAACSARS